jgi:hypothetical protein
MFYNYITIFYKFELARKKFVMWKRLLFPDVQLEEKL